MKKSPLIIKDNSIIACFAGVYPPTLLIKGGKKNDSNLIAYTAVVKNSIKAEWSGVKDAFSYMGLDKVKILFIINDECVEDSMYKNYIINVLNQYCEVNIYYEINVLNLKEFLSDTLDNTHPLDQMVDFKTYLFIFNGYDWKYIVHQFKLVLGVGISGGSTTKRHILSHLVLRLTSYLLGFTKLKYKTLADSIMFDNSDKDLIQPRINYHKKGIVYHKVDGEIIKLDNNCVDKNLNTNLHEAGKKNNVGLNVKGNDVDSQVYAGKDMNNNDSKVKISNTTSYKNGTNHKRYYHVSSKLKFLDNSDSSKGQLAFHSNKYYIDDVLTSTTFELKNFFINTHIIREKARDFPYSEYEWEDDITYINDDLYNYFYKNFLWDYYLTFDGELEPGIDFDYIYLVFYKTDPTFIRDSTFYKRGGNNYRLSCNINIWYYEKISVSDLNTLRNNFINAYSNNMYDDLDNSIQGFLNNVMAHLFELWDSTDYDDLYINIIVPRNKKTSLA